MKNSYFMILLMSCLALRFIAPSLSQTSSIVNATSYTGSSSSPTITSEYSMAVSGDTSMPLNNTAVPTQYAVRKYIDSNYSTSPTYNRSGLINLKLRRFIDTFSITSASQSLDISSMGYNKIYSISVIGLDNTSTVSSIPSCSIKSYTTSSVTINVLQSNTTTVSLLGAIVAGLSTATNFTGLKVFLEVIGN